jgi:chromosome segregation protein
VNKKYTLDKLREIKSQYADWKLRADKKDKFSSNEIKTFLIKTEGQIEGLIKGIRNGKIKKVKAQEEINKQRIKIKELIKDYEQEISAKDKNIQKKQVRIEKIKKQQEDIKQAEIKQREEELQAKDELRRKEFELEKASGYQNHLNQALNNKKREILELKKKIKEELNQDPKNLSGLERTKDACQLEKEIEKINWQLEQIGGVDEAAIRKFDEIQKRYDFLVKEAKDLEETLKNLNKVAEEMDVIIKKRFEQAFEGVNKKFGNYFEKIFGGGKAFLKKVEVGSGKTEEFLDEKEENKKIGIEVEVYPPGKKIKSLGMLSGGERSLTSAALLFAIIDHNPPPFVFMDEVEANLDDANSLRLSRSLKDLSGKTQFILATHNKQTMKQASFLYGISMREDGCSKVYSLKLS